MANRLFWFPRPRRGRGTGGGGTGRESAPGSRTSRTDHPQRGTKSPRCGGAPPAGPPPTEQSAPTEGEGRRRGPRGMGGARRQTPGAQAATDNHARDRNQAARAARKPGRRQKPARFPIMGGGGRYPRGGRRAPGRIPNEPRHSPRSAGAHGATATGAAPADLTRGRDGGPRRGLHRCPPGVGGPHRKRSTILPRTPSRLPSRPAAGS